MCLPLSKYGELTISSYITFNHREQLEREELHDHHKQDGGKFFHPTLSVLMCYFTYMLVALPPRS
jgi:hypothetical protein